MTFCPCPKPTPHPVVKAKLKAARLAERKEFRRMMVRLDQYRCRSCGVLVYLATRNERLLANVHEVVPKSLGGNDRDAANCLTLCGVCHPYFTHHEWSIVLLDARLGARGPVEVVKPRPEDVLCSGST